MFDQIKSHWNEIISYVKDEYGLTGVSFNTWIQPLQPYKLSRNSDGENVLDILINDADNNFKNYVSKKYGNILMVAVEEITGVDCKINFVIPSELNAGSKKNLLINKDRNSVNKQKLEESNLNSKYTFDSFVVGKNNNFAHAASLAVAETPGEIYNPLFIYGGAGLGKTHLMQAIAHFILEKDPEKRVLYVPSETFTNEIVEAIRKGTTEEFRLKYRGNDVFLIDDIQFIVGKDRSQEEFFHTFNEMYEHKKQVIVSSDRPPKDFTLLEERLRSRLGMGLNVDIQTPDYETRMAILRRKEEEAGYNVDNEVLKYIAENIKSNIRELEGALTRVIAMSKLDHNREITVDFAKEALKDLINPDQAQVITPENIISIVCEHFGINEEDILSPKRNKEIVYPRQITMYLMRELTNCSLENIGLILGNRDHTTVMHGIEKISTEKNVNNDLNHTLDILTKKLSSR